MSKPQTSTQRAWRYMHRICTDRAHPGFAAAGGRGAQVCERWHSYQNFLADMGDCPTAPDGRRYLIGRLDDSKGFTPENCRWMTRGERMRRSHAARLVTFEGRTCSVAELAEERGLTSACVCRRLSRGQTLEKALRPVVAKDNVVTFRGETLPLGVWAQRLGMQTSTLARRFKVGWSVERALTTPGRAYVRKKGVQA